MFEKDAEEYVKVFTDRSHIWSNDKLMQLQLREAYKDGAEFGYNSAVEWFDAKTSIPLPKQLGIYRYTIEAISDKGDIVCYDYKDKCWKKIVIEDEKVTYVPVEIEMWCNKPAKEIGLR